MSHPLPLTICVVPLSSARPAETSAILADERVRLIKRMAGLTVGGSRLKGRDAATTKDVLAPRCRLSVIWIDASPMAAMRSAHTRRVDVVASVVKTASGRDRAFSEDVRDAMGELLPAVDENPVSVRIDSTVPLPTPARCHRDQSPEIVWGVAAKVVMARRATELPSIANFIRMRSKGDSALTAVDCVRHTMIIPNYWTKDSVPILGLLQ